MTMALDDDVQRLSLLKRHTYERTEGFDVLYRRSLGTPIVAPKLDPSLLLRHPTDADLDARVDVHRDSWSVWGPSAMSKTTVVCETRQFTILSWTWCSKMRRAVSSPTASGGSTWRGHFEPVGSRPNFTGRGYARAVTIEGMRRMQARGMHTALVATASVNARARVLYPSCGFVEVHRAHTTQKASRDERSVSAGTQERRS